MPAANHGPQTIRAARGRGPNGMNKYQVVKHHGQRNQAIPEQFAHMEL
jgi:hypothetical protein